MNYAAARGQIQSGDLLAWTHRAWGSWYDIQIQIVRTFTQSRYCHVGVAWNVAGRLMVLEAVATGVRIFPLSRLVPFDWLPIKAAWEPEVEAWALQQVGEPYSKWQAMLAGVGLLKAGEDSIWQCAEYAQQVALRGGVELPGKATPANLVAMAMEQRCVECWAITRDAA